MKRKKLVRSRLAVGALAGVLLASACAAEGGTPSTPNENPEYQAGFVGDQADPGEPVQGGTLTVADYSEAKSLDPTQTSGLGPSGGNPMAAIYDVLIRYNSESASFEPWLAKDLTSSDDFATWTLHLRDNVLFSDGVPLDAAAVVGSITYYMDNGGDDASLLQSNIEKMEVEDDLTVVFHLRDSWSKFSLMLAQSAGMIVAPAAIEGDEFTPIGAGPFTFGNYAPEEELVLDANEDYWHGTPYLDQLRFVWLKSDQATLEAMKSGEFDAAHLRDPEVVDQALHAEFPGFLDVRSLGQLLMINNREGRPGEDIRVRKAIAYAIDPDFYNERVHDGLGLAGKQLFHPSSRWHTGVDPVPEDQAEARKLLEEAKADGYNGKLRYMGATDPASREEALAVKAMLEAVGFTVEFDLQHSVADVIRKGFVEHDYDLLRSATQMTEEAPYVRLHTALYSESDLNGAGYDEPEMDVLVQRLQAVDPDDERKQLLAEIEQLWNETVPTVSLGAAAIFVPWKDRVHGIVPSAGQLMLFGQAWKSE